MADEQKPSVPSSTDTHSDNEAAATPGSTSDPVPDRPGLKRAATTTKMMTKVPAIATLTGPTALPASNAQLSRPAPGRAATTAAALNRPSTANNPPSEEVDALRQRPSFFRRITSGFRAAEGTGPQQQQQQQQQQRPGFLRRLTSAFTVAEEPEFGSVPPTNYIALVHRGPLLAIYKAVHEEIEKESRGEDAMTLSEQMRVTGREMVKRFPVLGQGEVPLDGAFVYDVVKEARRHPFNRPPTPPSPGQWTWAEKLAWGGGSRMNWGPW
ncbi:hypothetical protein MBLNU230_g3030t1 [Neophaeotheca triangularis]